MADPVRYDMITDRNVDHFETWEFLNVDWTGSTFKMQVRRLKNTTGTPLLEHTTAGGSFAMGVVTATVAAHVAAGRLAGTGADSIYTIVNPATGNLYQPTDSLLVTQVSLGIAVSVEESFPFAEVPSDDFEAYYDILRTPSVGSAELILAGKFIVRAGVTIP